MLHVLYDEGLQVPQPPDALHAVPVDGPAAGDVEVLQGVRELPSDPVHAPLVYVLAVGQVQPLKYNFTQKRSNTLD